jgi:hypothetical protein
MKKETEKLLQECASGTKMGEHALSLALPQVKNADLKYTLEGAIKNHAIIGDEARKMLFSAHRKDKDPSPLITMMSDVKMKTMMLINGSSSTIASLITDGCDMGTKTLSKALNDLPTADLQARHLANKLIATEDELRKNLRKFL